MISLSIGWAQSLDRINLGAAFLKEWYDSSIILISKKNIAEELELDDPGFNSSVLLSWSIPFTTNVSSSWRSYVLLRQEIKNKMHLMVASVTHHDRFG